MKDNNIEEKAAATQAPRSAGRAEAWREALRGTLPVKERTSIERVKMHELDPAERLARPTAEVNTGLTAEEAMQEARRCLDCLQPSCMTGCPVQIDIPGFIKNIERGEAIEACRVINLTSSLPAVCGRVCPQEKQCESKCVYNRMGKPAVAIGYLERFAADTARLSAPAALADADGFGLGERGPVKKRVAVVGSGPAGLAFAGEMIQRKDVGVTVFEALHEIGGVLKYGIPEFRLPNEIVDAEIDSLKARGVEFERDVVVGRTLSLDNLKALGFDAVFVGSGAGLPRFMNIPGENLNGVMSCNEYLTRINLMGAGRPGCDTPVMHGQRVAVIGGGNTAMDAVRTARRMGAEKAWIVYRRGLDEMPARGEEVHHALQEGVEMLTLHNPVEYLGDERGFVKAMRLQRMELGEPGPDGRRSPVPVEGDIVEMPVDMVIVSVGVSPNPLIPSSVDGLDVSRRGTIVVNDATMESNIEGLYAGGDIVRGGATVILAMGDGRRAAISLADAWSLEKRS